MYFSFLTKKQFHLIAIVPKTTKAFTIGGGKEPQGTNNPLTWLSSFLVKQIQISLELWVNSCSALFAKQIPKLHLTLRWKRVVKVA